MLKFIKFTLVIFIISGCFNSKLKVKKYNSDCVSFNYYSSWKITSDTHDEDENHFISLVPKDATSKNKIDIEYFTFTVDFPDYYKENIIYLHKNEDFKEISPKPIKHTKIGRFNCDLLEVGYVEFGLQKTFQLYAFDVDDFSVCILVHFDNSTENQFKKELKFLAKKLEFY